MSYLKQKYTFEVWVVTFKRPKVKKIDFWFLFKGLKVASRLDNYKDNDFAADVHVFAAKISPLIL